MGPVMSWAAVARCRFLIVEDFEVMALGLSPSPGHRKEICWLRIQGFMWQESQRSEKQQQLQVGFCLNRCPSEDSLLYGLGNC